MFVSFFSRVMLTSMSSPRVFSPMTCPSYTSEVGSMKKEPLLHLQDRGSFLPFVHLRGGVDEEGTAVLQVQQRVWSCRPGAVGDEGTRGAQFDRAHPRRVTIRDRRGDPGAAGFGEEAGAEPDEAAGGYGELHPH